jgi:chromosome segregation ATPase
MTYNFDRITNLGKIVKIYGGAVSETEDEYQRLKKEYTQLRLECKDTTTPQVQQLKSKLVDSRHKLEQILEGAATAIQDVNDELNIPTPSVNSPTSSQSSSVFLASTISDSTK